MHTGWGEAAARWLLLHRGRGRRAAVAACLVERHDAVKEDDVRKRHVCGLRQPRARHKVVLRDVNRGAALESLRGGVHRTRGSSARENATTRDQTGGGDDDDFVSKQKI